MRHMVALICLALVACGCRRLADKSTNGQDNGLSAETPAAYFSTMKRLVVRVAYEEGAEPYTGVTRNGLSYWSVLSENLELIFAQRQQVVTIEVPTNLEEMTAFPAKSEKSGWTSQDLLSLADSLRTDQSDLETSYFMILFVNKPFISDGKIKDTVLGVSLGGTTVIGMFKDVIQSTGISEEGAVPKFVEQSTLVHEMGHALGLVNNGVSLSSEHHDHEHGAHCSNPDCVMYWQNEGRDNLKKFVQRFIVSGGDYGMLGQACLDDIRHFNP